MSPILWFIVLGGAPAIPLPQRVRKGLYNSFPLSLMRVHEGGSRLVALLRILFAIALFGCMMGLLGGATFMVVRALLPSSFSK